MDITSLDNKLVKKITSLSQKKYRDEAGEFFIEGIKTVEEAIKHNQEITNILYCPEMIDYKLEVPALKVSKEIIYKISDTLTPQGIIAVCKIPQYKIERKNKLVYLDRVQDPGNVGTIIRTADAFGFDGVMLSKGCADVYSPKVVRSTMGSLFHISIYQDVTVEKVKTLGNKIYSAVLDTNNFINDTEITTPFILVIGNEGSGISSEVRHISDEFIKINMAGNAESLNASIAAGILMYEFSVKVR